MNSESINIAPDSGAVENKSENKDKAKKFAGKSAQFAAAAGVGVAGGMAASAMNHQELADDVVAEATMGGAAVNPAPEKTTDAAAADDKIEEPTEFDPNEIRIDDVEEATISVGAADHHHGMAMNDGPEPILGDPIIASADDIMIAGIDESDDWGAVCSGSDDHGYDDFMAQNEPTIDDTDVLDDILNA